MRTRAPKGGNVEHWYALHTKPGKEFQVSEALNGQGIETYIPTYEPSGVRRHGKRPRPLFPGYLFVRVDFSSRGVSSVQWTPGLKSIVGSGDRPLVLPDQVVSHIREQLERSDTAWSNHDLQVDEPEPARAWSGPLGSPEAMFDRGSPSHERVKALQDALDRLKRASPSGS